MEYANDGNMEELIENTPVDLSEKEVWSLFVDSLLGLVLMCSHLDGDYILIVFALRIISIRWA